MEIVVERKLFVRPSVALSGIIRTRRANIVKHGVGSDFGVRRLE